MDVGLEDIVYFELREGFDVRLAGVFAGFLAVFLYRRRTGQRLSVASGARLGWICGIFGFVIVAVMLPRAPYVCISEKIAAF